MRSLLARRGLAAGATLAALLTASPFAQSAAPRPASTIDALVAAMTLDEKISMLHGATDPEKYGQAGYLPGVPRLGIPPLRLTDGPAGVRTASPATALPAPVALASTFSPDLARVYGRVIGRDGLARHQNVILAPMVNIVRVPQGGRDFETLGEDPLLAGRLVAAEIDGIQSQGLIATVKHFAFNNQENQRQSVSADVDEQTMHEIELPAFEAAVDAHVGAVMAAYNKVNGTYAAESAPLLTDILRGEWHFDGFVMSDWGATHSGVPALTAGMDMEMASGRNYGTLAEAVQKGDLDIAIVDRAVRRILTSMDRAGMLTAAGPQVDASRAPAAPPRPDIPTTSAEARDLAIAGAVLLKNDRQVLPLARSDLASLAVIGPTARVLLVGGGGSARVQPMHTDSPLALLERRAGSPIAYARGYDLDGDLVPASALSPAAGVTTPTIDATVPAGTTWTWTGTITAPATGDYVLKLQTSGGRGTLTLGTPPPPPPPGAAATGRGGRGGPGGGRGGGGRAAGLLATADGLSSANTPAHFDAGVAQPIAIAATAAAGGSMRVRLAWITPSTERTRIDEAVAAARVARTVVLFAYDEGQEGRDRASLSLPGPQDALIDAVAAANPRTVVVLNNGAPILMPWAGKTAAILQMRYPGQEGADATDAILAGDASPGGRLPVTFPARLEDAPTSLPERYPGIDGRGKYSEGIYVGYRWYDHEQIAPLFPFGFGLSYTTFAYSNLSTRPSGDGFDVDVTIRNTGSRAGVDVPQLYVGPAAGAPAPMAVQKLAGFERVSLAAGASTTVTFHVTARDLSYWSTADHGWAEPPGARAIVVGASSRDARLRGEIVVHPR